MVKYHDFREKYHKRVLALRAEPPVVFLSDDRGGGGGLLMRIVGGRVPPVPQILTHFRPKNVTFRTRFLIWPLKSIPILRPGL